MPHRCTPTLATPLALLACLAVAGLGCESGSGDSGPIKLPSKDTTLKDVVVEVVAETTTVEDVAALEPMAEINGIAELGELTTIFCASTMTVVVGAEEIEGLELRLVINDLWLIDVEPQDQGGDIYWFVFDGAVLQPTLDDPATPDVDESHDGLASGDGVWINVAGFPADADLGAVPVADYPTYYLPGADGEPKPWPASKSAKYDNLPPELDLHTPNPLYEPTTVTGEASFSGVARDDLRVGKVEIVYTPEGGAAETVASIAAAPTDEKTQQFEEDVDFRMVQTSWGQIVIRAYDTCGLTAEVALSETKVISWPFLRLPKTYVPGTSKTQVNASLIVDWPFPPADAPDEVPQPDGYPDVLLCTTTGLLVARNQGVDADPIGGQFRVDDIETLTPESCTDLIDLDVDQDGDLDIAVVRSVSGDPFLVLYRYLGTQGIKAVEQHPLPIASSTDIVDIIATDFTNDALQRDDIIIATSSQTESILLFKRQGEDEPQEFDDCHCVAPEDAGVDAADASADGADAGPELVCEVDAGGDCPPPCEWSCPTLFAPAVKAGGIEGIAQIDAHDVTGIDTEEPDGYPDLVVGIANKNEVSVFTNRFQKTGLLDTAFTAATISHVFPNIPKLNNSARHFCIANFIEDPDAPYDHVDMVVGTEDSGTWRVLRGIGGGQFKNGAWPPGDDTWDVYNMSGTTNGNVAAVVCDDFDQDGHEDFAILSGQFLMQVHLGNGRGRFNQLEDSDLLNPVNEGIGFVAGSGALGMDAADLDGDGYPDLVMQFRQTGLVVYRNTTAELGFFDLDAPRALVTPLGKRGTDTNGLLEAFTIADTTGDGKMEIVALSGSKTFGTAEWLKLYHPIGARYRGWFSDDGKLSGAPTVYVWRAGTYGPVVPSYPAAYDRMPRQLYPEQVAHGAVTPSEVRVFDLRSVEGPAKDGLPDLVIGGKPGATPSSHLALYVNSAPAGDFWDVDRLEAPKESMYRPHSGRQIVSGAAFDYEFVNPNGDPIPSIALGWDTFGDITCETKPPMIWLCPWNEGKTSPDGETAEPFWDCTCPPGYIGRELGGSTVATAKLAASGPTAGEPTSDPDVEGHVFFLNQGNASVSVAEWGPGGADPAYPFKPTFEYNVGKKVFDLELRDLDNNGIVDLAVTVDKNVLVAFGLDQGEDPGQAIKFEAPLPVDRDPEMVHAGNPSGIVTSDVNNDGLVDIVFTEVGKNRVTIYLGIGPARDGSQTREFHGPIYVPTCAQPAKVMLHDFDGDGCETVVVLCKTSGAVALIENDTCAIMAQP